MGNCNNPTLAKTTNGPDPSGMKVWVTPPGKEPQPVEVFAEDKGNMEWLVINTSYDYMTSYRNKSYNCSKYEGVIKK